MVYNTVPHPAMIKAMIAKALLHNELYTVLNYNSE